MAQEREPASESESYPIGRGYGHDYLRGGEVLGGYGYSERPEYTRRLGDAATSDEDDRERSSDDPSHRRTSMS